MNPNLPSLTDLPFISGFLSTLLGAQWIQWLLPFLQCFEPLTGQHSKVFSNVSRGSIENVMSWVWSNINLSLRHHWNILRSEETWHVLRNVTEHPVLPVRGMGKIWVWQPTSMPIARQGRPQPAAQKVKEGGISLFPVTPSTSTRSTITCPRWTLLWLDHLCVDVVRYSACRAQPPSVIFYIVFLPRNA